ncbi:hypothetical protein KKE60_08480 [Patescibacteria group bacterium]|nr:hypothetical protein [Patescibacteria group bacterium]
MYNKRSKAESKIQGVPKRTNLYARVSKYAPKAIRRVVNLLDSKNESVALGAVKVILDKAIPDLKALEIDERDTSPIEIRIVEDRSNK